MPYPRRSPLSIRPFAGFAYASFGLTPRVHFLNQAYDVWMRAFPIACFLLMFFAASSPAAAAECPADTTAVSTGSQPFLFPLNVSAITGNLLTEALTGDTGAMAELCKQQQGEPAVCLDALRSCTAELRYSLAPQFGSAIDSMPASCAGLIPLELPPVRATTATSAWAPLID